MPFLGVAGRLLLFL